MKVISGNSNPILAQNIASELGMELTNVLIRRFSDNEIFVEVLDNVRGEDVFVIQSTSYPANDNLMELLITVDALRRSSARRITAVIPYFGYARQDRKTTPRTPISAKLVANLLTVAGCSRILTLDLHAGQIQGFFDIPLDNLIASPVFVQHIQQQYKDNNIMIVSPDIGGVLRSRLLAEKLQVDLAIVDKRREKAGVSEVMNIIGDVKGKNCIMVDDIIDTAGTICNAAQAIMNKGALSVSAYVSHGVLSGPAVERIEASPLNKVILTNSILPTEPMKKVKKIEHLDLSPLLAKAITHISQEKSVSCLFK